MAAAMWLLLMAPAQAAWESAHADGANSRHVDVATKAADRNSLTVPGLGTFAPGVAPVIAADGNVYIGNEQGELHALGADGSRLWSRKLPPRQSIKASAVIGGDGMIYVVGVSTARDHRTGKRVVTHASTLHRFVPGGGWLGGTPFPERHAGLGRGNTTAPQKIWRSNGVEAIIVPVVYSAFGGYDLRLVAFSTGGGVLAESRVTYVPAEIGVSGFPVYCAIPPLTLACLLGFPAGFQVPQTIPEFHGLPLDVAPPMPGVALIESTPWVIVTDQKRDVVVYAFSPEQGFSEISRDSDPTRSELTSPTLLVGANSVVGIIDPYGGALVFGRPSSQQLPSFRTPGRFRAPPTRLPDDRLVLVEQSGGVAVLRRETAGYVLQHRTALPGHSIAPAAASRAHIFVSTASAFYTFDARDMREIARVDWLGGGLWPPVIGPRGHVYAMASNILFVFPPPALQCWFCRDVAPPAGSPRPAPLAQPHRSQ